MRNKLTDELAVCGLNAVIAVAEYHPEQINRLFLREDRLELFTGICKNLAERKRPYKFCDDEELEKICKSTHHQGVVAMILLPEVKPLSREDLEEWSSEAYTGLVLHSIGNDHNLGAIVRSAAFFDVKYIIIAGVEPPHVDQALTDAESSQPPPPASEPELKDPELKEAETKETEIKADVMLTTSSYRVAEGGMEHVTIRSVRDTAAFLREASRHLLTIGTDPRARQRIGDLPKIITEKQGNRRTETSRPGIAVVLGNEETGLPDKVKNACSVILRIPGTGLMESLNVAQTAALFMHRIFEL